MRLRISDSLDTSVFQWVKRGAYFTAKVNTVNE